jgi:hypothetical protein
MSFKPNRHTIKLQATFNMCTFLTCVRFASEWGKVGLWPFFRLSVENDHTNQKNGLVLPDRKKHPLYQNLGLGGQNDLPCPKRVLIGQNGQIDHFGPEGPELTFFMPSSKNPPWGGSTPLPPPAGGGGGDPLGRGGFGRLGFAAELSEGKRAWTAFSLYLSRICQYHRKSPYFTTFLQKVE